MVWTLYKWVVEYPSSSQALADRDRLTKALKLQPSELTSRGDEKVKVEIAQWWPRVVQATCATRNGNNPSLTALISVLGNPSVTDKIREGLEVEAFI